MQVLSCD